MHFAFCIPPGGDGRADSPRYRRVRPGGRDASLLGAQGGDGVLPRRLAGGDQAAEEGQENGQGYQNGG